MSLKFDHIVGQQCLRTAVDSINAIHEFWTRYHNNTDRYFCTIFLISAVMPLSCIILRPDLNGTRTEATASFNKALQLMTDIADGFTLTRRMIERLQSVIDVATRPATFRIEGQEYNLLETLNRDVTNMSEEQNLPYGQQRAQRTFSNVGTPYMGDFSGMWDLGLEVDSLINYQTLIPMG